MFFRSAVDPWFYTLVVALPMMIVGMATPLINGLTDGLNYTALLLVGVVLVLLMVLPTWLLFSTYYRVDSTMLSIHSGPFFWTVPITQIHDVTPVRSLSVSPALSVTRLRIEYGRQLCLCVSPKHRTAFLEALGLRPATILQPVQRRPNPFALGENY